MERKPDLRNKLPSRALEQKSARSGTAETSSIEFIKVLYLCRRPVSIVCLYRNKHSNSRWSVAFIHHFLEPFPTHNPKPSLDGAPDIVGRHIRSPCLFKHRSKPRVLHRISTLPFRDGGRDL